MQKEEFFKKLDALKEIKELNCTNIKAWDIILSDFQVFNEPEMVKDYVLDNEVKVIAEDDSEYVISNDLELYYYLTSEQMETMYSVCYVLASYVHALGILPDKCESEIYEYLLDNLENFALIHNGIMKYIACRALSLRKDY